MPRLVIPSQRWVAGFPGERVGNIWHSKGIDLERIPGSIVPGESFSSIFQDADLTTSVAFVRTAADNTDRWWALGAVLAKSTNTDPESTWAQDAIASSPTDAESDMIEYRDALITSSDTDLDRLNAGTWTNPWWSTLTNAAALTSSPHRFGIHTGVLWITDGRFINTYDGTTAVDPDLTLPNDYEARWIRSIGDFGFIGTTAVGDRLEAAVFAWDGTSATFNAIYPIGDREALCGFSVRGVLHIVTKRGEIKKLTGQGFVTVQQFPNFELGLDINDIHPNGVTVDGHIVKFLVSFGASTGTGFGIDTTRLIDGIWVWNSDTNNLYHWASVVSGAGNDYAQLELSAVGALVRTQPTQGRYLAGATAYQSYTATTSARIFSSDEDASTSRGWFMTSKIPSQNIQNFWREFLFQMRRLRASSDVLNVAYRVRDDLNLPVYKTVTWVNTTRFDLSAGDSNLAVGNFVEVLAGPNAGAVVRVTAITSSTQITYTPALNAATTSARVRFLPFTNIGSLTSQSLQSEIFRVAARSPWVQLLVELRGTENSPELQRILVDFDAVKI